MTFFTALLLTKWRGTERNFPLDRGSHDRGEAMTAVGMKTRSRGQGRAAGVGFESGLWLSMVDEGGFWGRLSRTAARRTSQSDSSISRRRASADSDAYPPAGTPATTAVGRPTTNAESSSTEGKTPSRSLYGCGSSAPAMLRASMLRRGGQMKPDLDENLDRLVRISAGAIIAG